MSKNLEKTGERVIVDKYLSSRNEYFIYQCHMATYQFAVPYVTNKKVLEFGCGSGYGSDYISGYCSDITAVDISNSAIEFAKEKFKKKNLSFDKIEDIEKTPLKFDDNIFDIVISFQVIEHLSDDHAFLSELFRVLKKGGILLLATPDKTHRIFSFQKPWNRYHIREYSMSELKSRISEYFQVVDGYYMSARKDLIDMEITRTKKLRVLTLPFTLFFVPEFIRIFFITLLKKIKVNKKEKNTKSFDFNTEDIYLTKDNNKSINLLLVAKKKV